MLLLLLLLLLPPPPLPPPMMPPHRHTRAGRAGGLVGRTDGRMDEQADARMGGRTIGQVGEQADAWTGRRAGGRAVSETNLTPQTSNNLKLGAVVPSKN